MYESNTHAAIERAEAYHVHYNHHQPRFSLKWTGKRRSSQIGLLYNLQILLHRGGRRRGRVYKGKVGQLVHNDNDSLIPLPINGNVTLYWHWSQLIWTAVNWQTSSQYKSDCLSFDLKKREEKKNEKPFWMGAALLNFLFSNKTDDWQCLFHDPVAFI